MKKKLITTCLGIVLAVMISLFIYGIVRYPDSPIHLGKDGFYVGKQGQLHTEKEYKEFMTWQTCLFYIWPIGMITLFILNKHRKECPNQDIQSTSPTIGD
jgi:hypothetical protein